MDAICAEIFSSKFGGIGLDGGDIWVDEDDFVTFGFERFDCLRAGVVEFSRFADFERAGTEEEDF